MELESWQLFAIRRGYFGVAGRRGYDESKLPEFIAARQDWDDRHGFPDGEACRAARAPSAELADFEVWCVRRGVKFHLTSGEDSLPDYAQRQEQFELWCAARAAFAAQFGWEGGREVRRREERAVTPFDLSAI